MPAGAHKRKTTLLLFYTNVRISHLTATSYRVPKSIRKLSRIADVVS